jgi:chromosome condensin MukBEF complex kleisin-like MukF subunit
MARKRPTVSFFGTDCQIEKLAANTIEADRVEAESARLRDENTELRSRLSEEIKGQLATALRLADLMEREPALVAAVERAEAAYRDEQRSMRIAMARIEALEAEVDIYQKGIAA